MRDHDDDPVRVAAELRELPAEDVAPEDRPRLTWLVNHVIGEKENRWPEALDLHIKFGGDDKARGVARNRAVAAILSAAPLEAWKAEADFSASAGCTFSQAQIAVRLGVLQHVAPSANVEPVAAALLDCLDEIGTWTDAGSITDMLAASLNNVVSALLERDDAPAESDAYRRALSEGARAGRTLWLRAGTWVNHERAEYLVALCANATEDWSAGKAAAQSGLDIIAANGSEDVDRAFLLLELSRALAGEGDDEASRVARAQAFAIADGFGEQWLREWFESRARPA